MKIGILTFHRAINYGAVLQCYALYKTLSGMGHDVEIIDYRPYSIEKDRKYFRKERYKSNVSTKEKIKFFVSDISLLLSRYKTVRQFNSFISNSFHLSNTTTQGKDISQKYDIVFWGSDQIWSPRICQGLDRVYWGQIDLPHTKKVAYAASMGRIDGFSDDIISIVGKYLKAFDIISVREVSLQTFIKEHYNLTTEIVCDPSLLLKKEQYMPLVKAPTELHYVLLYLLEDNKEAVMMANCIAKQLNCEVIRLYGMKNPLKRESENYKSCISPQEFLSYIHYAKCVITNSFHAVSFSVIFNTDFYYVKRRHNNDRAYSLLYRIDLIDRFITANTKQAFSIIDFTKPNQKKESFRLLSLQYIENALIF